VELRAELAEGARIWASHYDFRPSKLFEGANQRLTIFVRHRSAETAFFSTRFNRWYASERPYLFATLSHTALRDVKLTRPIWPKLAGEVGQRVLRKVYAQERDVASVLADRGGHALYYKNTGMLYFTMFTREAPTCFINGEPTSSSRETTLRIRDGYSIEAVHAMLNSTLFYLVYVMTSNCRDLNPSDIHTFRFPATVLDDSTLVALSHELDANHQVHSEMRVRMQRLTGEVRIQTFQPAMAKPILDEIDEALARHYGFDGEEVDFVITYDARYRTAH
jgi:hypothetical protein